jgi:hypothetical protein
MGSRTFRPIARMARPITTERDYRGVKNLVAERAWTFFFVETERLEALVRELTDYEIRVEESAAGFTVEWAEWAFVQKENDPEEQSRRWGDMLQLKISSRRVPLSAKSM